MATSFPFNQSVSKEGYATVGNARLYYRVVGQGQPMVVLHGGPDFDHNYLLPDMDRLSRLFRIIYYDQRGRGRSGENVRPEDVTLKSEMEDLESLREFFQLDSIAVLGHSWGGLLAMEYATRLPDHVSHLILMNTAPASHDDFILFRQERQKTAAEDLEKMRALSSTSAYQAGDIQKEAQYYRIHFKAALRQPEHLEQVIGSLRLNWSAKSVQRHAQLNNGCTKIHGCEATIVCCQSCMSCVFQPWSFMGGMISYLLPVQRASPRQSLGRTSFS
jgi:proline-specific peptidase